ncbi:transposase [Sphingomonas aestuarii]
MTEISGKQAKYEAISLLIKSGRGVVEACREIGVSERTFSRWRVEAKQNSPSS